MLLTTVFMYVDVRDVFAAYDNVGISDCYLSLGCAVGFQYVNFDYDNEKSIYVGEMPINKNTYPQTYAIEFIHATDKAGNITKYT